MLVLFFILFSLLFVIRIFIPAPVKPQNVWKQITSTFFWTVACPEPVRTGQPSIRCLSLSLVTAQCSEKIPTHMRWPAPASVSCSASQHVCVSLQRPGTWTRRSPALCPRVPSRLWTQMQKRWRDWADCVCVCQLIEPELVCSSDFRCLSAFHSFCCRFETLFYHLCPKQDFCQWRKQPLFITKQHVITSLFPRVWCLVFISEFDRFVNVNVLYVESCRELKQASE